MRDKIFDVFFFYFLNPQRRLATKLSKKKITARDRNRDENTEWSTASTRVLREIIFQGAYFSDLSLPLSFSLSSRSQYFYTLYLMQVTETKASNYNVQPLSFSGGIFITLVIIIRDKKI